MVNLYNEIWTREKFLEYRKLKREGYSHEMLKEHFGDDIYQSGLYNKNSSILPCLEFLTKKNPLWIVFLFLILSINHKDDLYSSKLFTNFILVYIKYQKKFVYS